MAPRVRLRKKAPLKRPVSRKYEKQAWTVVLREEP